MAKLIVIDGLDGSGKATQTKLLAEKLRLVGKDVVELSFPAYESKSSTAVQMYLHGEISKEPDELSPYACASFYAVDRYIQYIQHNKKYFERDDNTIILADRYISANIIHQGSRFNSKYERNKFIEWAYKYECELMGSPKEDYTLILMVNPKASQILLSKRYNNNEDKKDILESDLKYLETCYSRLHESIDYINQSGISNWDSLDCTTENNGIFSIEHIHNLVYTKVKQHLNLKED